MIRERLHGRRPVHELGPIGDDFVLALRAEAGDDDLSIRAALPLVTVAANLGELELLYPEPVHPPPCGAVSGRPGAASAHSAGWCRTCPR